MLSERQFSIFVLIILSATYLESVELGTFSRILNLGPRTNNCKNWSSWGECLALGQVNDFSTIIPPTCRENRAFKFVSNSVITYASRIYLYLNRLFSHNDKPCGMFTSMLSCSTDCGDIHPSQFYRWLVSVKEKRNYEGPTLWGISDRSCPIPQRRACLVPLSRTLTNCSQIWPPKFIAIRAAAGDYLSQLLEGFGRQMCIQKDNICYCCSRPYYPDPCTNNCILFQRFPNRPILSNSSLLKEQCYLDEQHANIG